MDRSIKFIDLSLTRFGVSLFFFFLILCSSGHAQIVVRGKVIDKITREPLELAVITEPKTTRNTLTDKQGNFIFKNASPDTYLTVSYIGYSSSTIKIDAGHQGPLIVQLEKGPINMREVTITAHSGIGTYRAFSLIDLNMQPAKSAQDLLRLVPGLFIAQHQGGGKAEQIFLRGFDCDHGTDVNVSVDGMPVNMVSHAHGQGYADLHFLIPETVAGYDFGKGPYYTQKGDLNTAGYVAYDTKNVLDNNMVKLEAGQFTTGRAVAMINLLGVKARDRGQSAYVAGEALYSNGGPFALPEHFTRYNLFGKFITPLGTKSKLNMSVSTLSSNWRASGEIPNRAVSEGYIKNRFGVIDSAQGGFTSRTNAILKLSTDLGNNFTWENSAYYSYYYFNLISNFTFYYYFPQTGDEFRQHDERNVFGYNTKITKQSFAGNNTFTTVMGGGFRYDHIDPSELDHTQNGNFLSYLQYGRTKEVNANGYFEEIVSKGNWQINAGLRLDYFHFYYLNMAPLADSFASKIYTGVNPNAQKAILCPKFNIQYTFNQSVQLYFKSGKGFHSNDARVVIANQGYQVLPGAFGLDLGTNWKPMPSLFINTALWYLYLQQEFTFGQDLVDQPGGPVQPSGKTSRMGIDFSARYQFNSWLFASLNLDAARPRYLDSAAGHQHLALAPTFTSTAGLDFRFKSGWNGGISYRYLHNRSANSTYTLTALGYWITDLTVNYTKKNYEVGLSIQNLFNVAWNESQFEYTSRLKYETAPEDEVSYTPGVPIFAKLKFSVFF
jgi:TonB dependent receptor/CarboxypepD_reg-like domain/TonB-dependent Receptor Plug Domain